MTQTPEITPPDPETPALPATCDHIRSARWTKRKMAEFLRELAATHSVSAAARAVGMSRQSAYRLRSRLKGKAFDIAWDVAFQHSYDNLAHAALERALNGVEIPVFYKGEQVGSYRRFDEKLTVALLRRSTLGKVPLDGRNGPAAELHARRFEALVKDIAANGGDAELPPPEDAPPGELARLFSATLSPLSDEALMADLRAYYGGEEG